MQYPALQETVILNGGAAYVTTAAQTLSYRIRQENRRLEYILFHFRETTGGVAPTGNGDGLGGRVKEVRLRVNDVKNSRNMIQARGPALLSFARNNVERLDRETQRGYAGGNISASASIWTTIPIFLRHPLVNEPFGNQLSLPLGKKLKDEPVLEIDLRADSEVFSANVPTGLVAALTFGYRDVPEDVPYIPSELRTDTFDVASVGKATFEMGSVGILTQMLIQGYSAKTYANNITRTILADFPNLISVEYGRTLARRNIFHGIQALNDYSIDTYPNDGTAGSAQLFQRNMQGESFYDFFADLPIQDGWSINSAFNLDPYALGGDKFKVIWNDWTNASAQAVITYHRLLPNDITDLKGLTVGA